MAESMGDDLLDGDLDETGFNELDAEEEDALLADDDYESYQNNTTSVYSESSSQREDQSQLFHHIVDQVQDVLEGDEILQDAEPEDILELAVVDELDEADIDSGQPNNQDWGQPSSRGIKNQMMMGEADTRMSMPSSLRMRVTEAESDEEESDGRGSRFKTERTNNVISLKGMARNTSENIPDSLDKVATVLPERPQNMGMRGRGGRGGRGGVRDRLGPVARGGPMQRGGFRHMRRGGFPPNMRPPPPHGPHPPYPPHPPPPGHKIHINPHFRGGVHEPPGVWNERIPPSQGNDAYPPNFQVGCVDDCDIVEGGWQNGHSYPTVRPPLAPQHPFGPGHPGPPGPPGQFYNPQGFPPHPPPQQNYEEQYPVMMDSQEPDQSNRTVHFSETAQLVTVENPNYQRSNLDPNYGPRHEFHPPQNNRQHFNNFQNNFMGPRPMGPPQQFPPPNQPPNYMDYQQTGYPPHQNGLPYQGYDNSWNQPQGSMEPQPFYPPQPHLEPQHQPPGPPYVSPQPPRPLPPRPQQPRPQFRPQFQNANPQPRHLPPKGFQVHAKVPIRKRLSLPVASPQVPAKVKKFEPEKLKPNMVSPKGNLLEIKTIDTLPLLLKEPEPQPEPEIEEDEETKQYRLKIAEQKALREKILREKEARRLATVIEKQKQQESSQPKPVVQKPVIAVPPSPQTQVVNRGVGRGRGRGHHHMNRPMPRQVPAQQLQAPTSGAPIVQIQQMMGTVYKIVKVRTKEGAIVTKKTPLVINSGSNVITPMKTVTSTNSSQRRVVLDNRPQLAPVKMVNQVMMKAAGVGVVRPGSNLFQQRGRAPSSVNTQANFTKTVQQRVVIDSRAGGGAGGMRLAASANIPVSSLLTVDNLSLSTNKQSILKLVKQVGTLCEFKHEPELKRATLKFHSPKEAEQFYLKFHRKMIDLSRINVTVIPEK